MRPFRAVLLAALLGLSGCGVGMVPLIAAGLGFATAEVGVLPSLASEYLCYKGHATECAPPPPAATP